MTDYRIEELNPNNEKDWEEFNKKTDCGSFFHTLKWKNILNNSFSYKLHYFLIYFEGKVIAICPFCENTIKGFRGLMPPPNSDHRELVIKKQNCTHLLIKELLNKTNEILKSKKLSFILISTFSKEIKDYFNKPLDNNSPEKDFLKRFGRIKCKYFCSSLSSQRSWIFNRMICLSQQKMLNLMKRKYNRQKRQ